MEGMLHSSWNCPFTTNNFSLTFLLQDDVESIVKAIEEEEKKRNEVKEVKLKESPSHRSNLSIVPHPEAPEIVLFGGEFHNGQKVRCSHTIYAICKFVKISLCSDFLKVKIVRGTCKKQ